MQIVQPEELSPNPLSADYELKSEEHYLGGGGYGIVYKADWNGNEVAVKKLKFSSQGTATPAQLKQFRNEVAVMQQLRQPNLVTMFGIVSRPDCCCIIMEYHPISLGTKLRKTFASAVAKVQEETKETVVNELFSKAVAKAAEGLFPMALRLHLLHGVLKCLSAMHAKSVAHRDLKPANVLLADGWRPKLIDFGLSKVVVNKGAASGQDGTLIYMAPELFGDDPYDVYKADIYSCGMFLYELALLRPPFFEFRGQDKMLISSILGGRRPKLPSGDDLDCVPEWLFDLMETCWDHDPAQRPTIAHIEARIKEACDPKFKVPRMNPVSYTHLTLPTNREV